MSELSTLLFARPTFAEGMGRLVDFGNFLSEYNYSESGAQADAFATWADWTAVGNDMRSAWAKQWLETRMNNPDVKAIEEATSAG